MIVNKKVMSAMTNALKLAEIADNPEAVELIPNIQPVILVNAMEQVGTLIDTSATLDMFTTVAVDELVPAYTCPAGKRAYIISASIGATVSIKQIVQGLAGSTTDYGPLTAYLAGATTLFALATGHWLNAGRSLGVRSNRQAADTAIPFSYIVVEVDW